MLFRSRAGALILIIVGALLLLSNLGWIPRLGPLLHQWWPLILILVGRCDARPTIMKRTHDSRAP
jgi:hypothetical protein